MRIAYIGPAYGTSLHRARALERLGHAVSIIDLSASLPASKWVSRWLHHACGVGLLIDDRIVEAVKRVAPQLVWVDQGNRDLHTTRSMEIPAMGGLLCAKRTSEHPALYEEGVEAVFWCDADECAEQCMALLADEPRRKAIAAAGHARAPRNGHSNQRVMARILDAAMGEHARPAQGAGA